MASSENWKAAASYCARPAGMAACKSKLATTVSASPRKKCPTSTSKASASAMSASASASSTAKTSNSTSKATKGGEPPSASTSPNWPQPFPKSASSNFLPVKTLAHLVVPVDLVGPLLLLIAPALAPHLGRQPPFPTPPKKTLYPPTQTQFNLFEKKTKTIL